MVERTDTRDLLAERIRRLERRIGELGDRIGATGEPPESVCRPLPEEFVALPDAQLEAHYRERLPKFRALYRDLRAGFRE